MIKIITQELEIESNLKQRLEFIWEFWHIKPTIINGSIRKIDKTNLSYIEPHKIIVKDTTFLAFNYSTDIYVGSLNKKIQLVELEDYIKKIQINGNKRSQIVNFNLEDVDDRFARTIVKIFGRMFMKFTKGLQNRASYPIHMILEEAHRYVLEGDDKKLFGYNIFERIAKEGRKHGLILDLITQRPTD